MPINKRLISGVAPTSPRSRFSENAVSMRRDSDSTSQCAKDGQAAFIAGLALTDNPHDIRSAHDQHYAWAVGWRGMEAAQGGKKEGVR